MKKYFPQYSKRPFTFISALMILGGLSSHANAQDAGALQRELQKQIEKIAPTPVN